jgi:hypothetical protein
MRFHMARFRPGGATRGVGILKVAYLLTGVCGLLVSAGAASAQAPPAAPSHAVPGVTVTAPANLTPAQQVERFGQVDSDGRLARWDQAICPAVVGLGAEFNAFIVKRIRDVADQVAAHAAPEPCHLNVLVLITPKPDEVTHKLAEYKARQLAGGRWGIDKAKLETFSASKEPVRWLYLSGVTQTSGGGAATPAAIGAAGDVLSAFFGNSALNGQPQFDKVTPSRLRPTGDEAFTQALIIVDANRIAGLSAGQVADYLAMASLAHVRAESSFAGTDTVLNLFAPGLDAAHRPAGLTPWDTDYLTALYRSDGQTTFSAQVSHITTRMKAEESQSSPANAPK